MQKRNKERKDRAIYWVDWIQDTFTVEPQINDSGAVLQQDDSEKSTTKGVSNRTLLRKVLRRFFNSKCFLEGFLEGACKGSQ